jgi:uncharacterized protein YdhG (YjbR/CyaY superfamily)
MPTAKKPAKRATADKTFSDDERAAMKEYVAEKKKARSKNFDGEAEVLAKIAELTDQDRKLAERIHAIVKDVAPHLQSKTWYGMPAYATPEGKTVCFFQSGAKFKTRYATLGFSDQAKLDDGNFWPNSYALTKLTAADETKIAALIKQAAS